jgi:beta-galactosidase
VTSADIAVNVGSNANFTDPDNVIWLADRPYSKGVWGFFGKDVKYIYSGADDQDILGTNHEPLFQTMQQGLAGYKFDVPAGAYSVELNFAETKFRTAGQRIFDVKINGKTFLARLDIAEAVGINRALSKRFEISTTGGLSIEFVSHSGEPVVSAIRIRRLTNVPQLPETSQPQQ